MNKIINTLLSFILIISPLSIQASEIVPGANQDKYSNGTSGSGTQYGRDFYLLQGKMIAMAVTAGNMVTCVPLSYHFSHYPFILGGANFMVGEVDNANDNSDYHKRKLDDIKLDEKKLNLAVRGTVTSLEIDAQSTALKNKLDDEIQNKKSMESRLKYAKRSKFLYELAMGLAITEGILNLASFWTGFTPDILICPGLIGGMAMTGMVAVYGAAAMSFDKSNGKVGLNQAAFMALLTGEILIYSAAAIIAVWSAVGRAAYFGLAANVAGDVVDGLEQRITIVDGNIKLLQTLLTDWLKNSNPGDAGIAEGASVPPSMGGDGQPSLHISSPTAGGVAAAAPVRSNQLPACASSSASGMNYSPSACNSPHQFNINLPKMDRPELSQITSQALTFGNEVMRGNTQRADVLAGGMLANASRLKEIRGELMKELNQKLVKAGEKPVDLDAVIKEKHQEMMNGMRSDSLKAGLGMPSPMLSHSSSQPEVKSHSDSIPAAATVTIPKMDAPQLGLNSDTKSDPTGLSDEEKDIMSANYDRNKGDYKTSEDDSLFLVVSKTYVRNLDKVLTRKKKLDDDSASSPSIPSEP